MKSSRIFLFLVLVVLPGCSRLFFYPSRTYQLQPSDASIPYETLKIPIDGHKSLLAWKLRPLVVDQNQLNIVTTSRSSPEKILVIHAHGNGGNMSSHLPAVAWLTGLGIEVMMFDYQGYGSSDGFPTIANSIKDLQTVIRYVQSQNANRNKRIVVLGQSLGGAITIAALADPETKALVDAVIIDSTFASYQQVAQETLAKLWLTWPLQLPLSLLVSDRLAPLGLIKHLSGTPILFIHSLDDQVIASHHSLELYEQAGTPKEFILTEKTGHGGSLFIEEVRRQVAAFITTKKL